MPASARTRRIVAGLCGWFAEHRRDLPWRATDSLGQRDPYHALVAETMLQQTQVSRVVERFAVFVAAYPTINDLAAADEDDVMALWSGLGYYRRARNLRLAAKEAVERFGGMPEAAEGLRALPGVGRYTAGAIASIVFGLPEPIVDGNVTRVLLRIEGQDVDPAAADTRSWCWSRADELAQAAHRSRAGGVSVGVFNEAMMELGATVCTPRAPACHACPVRRDCAAHGTGRQHEIPRPKRTATKRAMFASCLLVRDDRGRLLIEQRPKTGLWSGLWQPPTVETGKPVSRNRLASHFGVAKSAPIAQDSFVWETSHRSVRFEVYTCPEVPIANASRPRAWISPDELANYPHGSAQRRALLGEQPVPAAPASR